MRKAIWFLGLLAVVAAGALWLGFGLLPETRSITVASGGFETAGRPEPAPDISFSDAAGNSLTFDDLRGRVVLVNLWATWCAPCVEEMPSLDRLQARLGGDDFLVLPLSVDREGAAKVGPFYDELGIGHL
ncbi:MAG TPA: TlpA disulfide reductase family protein, partial [Alphaproteobacteria bacterium]|nr:TlpA disulfide reductase family protein [Alphaproteobacteria bacterium]